MSSKGRSMETECEKKPFYIFTVFEKWNELINIITAINRLGIYAGLKLVHWIFRCDQMNPLSLYSILYTRILIPIFRSKLLCRTVLLCLCANIKYISLEIWNLLYCVCLKNFLVNSKYHVTSNTKVSMEACVGIN